MCSRVHGSVCGRSWQYRKGVWAEGRGLFSPLQQRFFSQHMLVDRGDVWRRVLSKSYVASQTEEEQGVRVVGGEWVDGGSVRCGAAGAAVRCVVCMRIRRRGMCMCVWCVVQGLSLVDRLVRTRACVVLCVHRSCGWRWSGSLTSMTTNLMSCEAGDGWRRNHLSRRWRGCRPCDVLRNRGRGSGQGVMERFGGVRA
jgi:hypothetical protein